MWFERPDKNKDLVLYYLEQMKRYATEKNLAHMLQEPLIREVFKVVKIQKNSTQLTLAHLVALIYLLTTNRPNKS